MEQYPIGCLLKMITDKIKIQADANLATAQQIRMMSALFTGRGMDDDQIDALILEASASRTTSRKELTRTEASALIDQLKQATA